MLIVHVRDSQQFLMDLLQGIDSLLQLNVVRRELSLHRRPSAQHQASSAFSHTLSSAPPNCSLMYCWLRCAKGETVELKAELRCRHVSQHDCCAQGPCGSGWLVGHSAGNQRTSHPSGGENGGCTHLMFFPNAENLSMMAGRAVGRGFVGA